MVAVGRAEQPLGGGGPIGTADQEVVQHAQRFDLPGRHYVQLTESRTQPPVVSLDAPGVSMATGN